MNDKRTKRPWHLWVVCIFFFLLYLGGLRDYLMIWFDNTSYFASQNYNADQIRYFTDYPVIPRVFWTLNIFTAVLSPLFLFFGSKYTTVLAFIAFTSLIILDLITFGFRDRWNMLGTAISIFDTIILLLTLGFFLYSQKIRTQMNTTP